MLLTDYIAEQKLSGLVARAKEGIYTIRLMFAISNGA